MYTQTRDCAAMILLIAACVHMAVGQSCGEYGVTEEQCKFDTTYVNLDCAYGIGWHNLPTQNNTDPICQSCDFMGRAAVFAVCICKLIPFSHTDPPPPSPHTHWHSHCTHLHALFTINSHTKTLVVSFWHWGTCLQYVMPRCCCDLQSNDVRSVVVL
jgi:hypothetical protein